MNKIRKINDELAIAGQVTPEQLQQIAVAGFKAVLNLRSSEEMDFWLNEHEQAEALGLSYANVPVPIEAINDEVAVQVLQKINDLPKPLVVHCDIAKRATALVLIHIATRQGATLKQAYMQADQFGLFKTKINENTERSLVL